MNIHYSIDSFNNFQGVQQMAGMSEQAGNKFLCTQMTQMIKIDADFFYLSQRHEGHKEAIFSKAFFVSFVPL